METIETLEKLSVIAPNYKALLCDAWGVIHNGVNLFDGVEDALVQFRERCGPVLILTNAPRPSSIIPAQLDRLSLSRNAYDGVVTSGDAVRAEIINRLPAPVFRLGPEKDDPLYQGLDLDFVGMDEAAFIVCTGLIDDHREKPEDYKGLLQEARARDLEMICANPDIVVRWGDQLLYCAGAVAELYQEIGGRVVHGGKPHTPIYDLALKQMQKLNCDVMRSDILAIGDGLGTDIAGANAHNIDALYIFGGGGIHDSRAGDIAQTLHKAGHHAVAAMERLSW